MGRSRRLTSEWILPTLLFTLFSSPASATNIAWRNAVSGSWHSAANWNPSQVPGPSDVALITLSGNYTVTISSNASVTAIGLTSGTGTRRLHVNSAVLTTSTGIAVGASNFLTLNSGTISGAGTIDVDGTLSSTGNSAINSPVITHVVTTLSVGGDSLKVSGNLDNRGTLQLTATSTPVFLFVNGTLTNLPTGTFHAIGPFSSVLKQGSLDNQGDVTASAYLGLEDHLASHSSSGSITIPSGGNLFILGTGGNTFTTSGNISIAGGTSLLVQSNGGVFTHTAGSISGAGTLTLLALTATFAANPTCGEIYLQSTIATFPSALVHDTQILTFRFSGVTAPSLTIAAGRTLSVYGGCSFDIPVVSNFGTVQTTGVSPTFSLWIDTTWTNQVGSKVQLVAGSMTGFSGFTNNGEVELSSLSPVQTVRLQSSGQFTNAVGAIFKTTTGAGGTRRLEARFRNNGLMDIQCPLTIAGSTNHTNYGTLSVTGGDLVIENGAPPSLTNYGIMTVATGRILRVSSGDFGSTGTLSGGGFLILDGNITAVFDQNPTISRIAIRQSAGYFNSPVTHGPAQFFELVDATLTSTQVTIAAGSTLNLLHSNLNTSLLVNQGILVVEQEGSVTGTINTSPGSRISMTASAGFGGSSLAVGQGFTNNGEITLEPVTNSPAILTVAFGTLVNAPGASIGSFTMNPTDLTQSTLGAMLDNRGQLGVNADLTLDSPAAGHLNSGNITVGEGDLLIRQTGTTPSFASSAGTLWINPDRTLHVQGGAITVSGGSVTGNGTLRLTGGANANFSVFPTLSALDMQSAMGTFPGTFNTTDTSISLQFANLISNVTNAAGHTTSMVSSSIQGVVSNIGTLDIQGASSLQAFLTNTGLITIQNGLFLSGGSTGQLNYGVIRVFGGTFYVSQTPAGFFSNNDTLKVYAGATLQVAGGEFRNETTGVLAGGGVLNMSGTTFINNGTINPGASPGIMTISGDVTMGSTSVLNMELGGASPGSGYDQIQISGSAVLNGTLNLSLVNGYFPTTGSTFDVVTCPSHSGQFATVTGDNVAFGNRLAFFPQPRPTDPIRLTTVNQAWGMGPSSGGPQRRAGHTCVYTGVSNRLILFGGVYEGGEFNDTWICEGLVGGGFSFWSQLTTTGTPPEPRQGHAAAYDAVNNRLIVYGGSSSSNPSGFSDVWVLSNANGLGGLATWTQLAPAGGTPGQRTGGGVGYNPASNRLILFGGVYPPDHCNYASNDVWILSNANGLGGSPVWTLLPTSGLPPFPRSGAVLAYDNATNHLIVHGGSDACAAILGEARYLTHADGLGGTPTWTTLPLSNPAAPGRTHHAGIYDAQTDRLIMFGGLDADGSTFLEDVFVLTGSTNPSQSGWSSLPIPVGSHPTARSGHSLSWDPLGRRIILFGGNADGQYTSDLWILQLTLDPGPVSGVPDPVPPIGPPADPDPDDLVSHFGFRKAPWPNPTQGLVSLTFGLPAAGEVFVDVFDVSGRHVRQLFSGTVSEGVHEVRWDGEGDQGPVASGIYHVVVRSGKERDTRRIAVLR